jgi:hypothetical protein
MEKNGPLSICSSNTFDFDIDCIILVRTISQMK